MSAGPQLLLIGAVAAIGVLHTIVPDHWVPITLIARQRGWSKSETALAALQAGLGHVLSTLLIAAVVWLAGVAVASRFSHVVDTAASIALIAFGSWVAVSAWRELRGGAGHGHGHGHAHDHAAEGGVHGPELRRIATDHGEVALSIHEAGVPPRFRLTGAHADAVEIETLRPDGARQLFRCADHGAYWESIDPIPEPHAFDIMLTIDHGGHAHICETRFAEQEHGQDDGQHLPQEAAHDPLYAPLRGDTALLTRHAHLHRHGRGAAHMHWHDHFPETAHPLAAISAAEPPQHAHRHRTSARTALLLILGSSPMVEGIPAFFAAGQYGIGLVVAMALVFALGTTATYVLLCVLSTAGLQRVRLGAFERYGEVLSGAFIALVGVAFWFWPVL
jgi:nickel/cobalt transporter (NicO) family protein